MLTGHDSNNGNQRIVDFFATYRPNVKHYGCLYRRLHQNAELPTQESATAKIVAQHLESLGLSVCEHIGGYGVTGELQNGTGPTVLPRAELDALPILEQTQLLCASTVRMHDSSGIE